MFVLENNTAGSILTEVGGISRDEEEFGSALSLRCEIKSSLRMAMGRCLHITCVDRLNSQVWPPPPSPWN